MTKLMKAASLAIVIFLTACSISELDAPSPNEEDYWARAGYTKSQIRFALSMCGQDEPWSIKNMEKVDWCMLKQGYIFIDSPYRYAHKQCHSKSPYLDLPSCRSLKGELDMPASHIHLSQTVDQIRRSMKPEPVRDPVECRKDKPMYEAAYCDCYIKTPYANLESCDRLLKYQYKWREPSMEPKSTQTQPNPTSPAEQLLRENLKELQRAQDKTQIKPYTPPANLPAVPQEPNLRLLPCRCW